jgi:MFS family permease
VPAVFLRRNRDFVLLQLGQLFSNAGTQTTSIAYPLLVLAVTHSAAQTGVVSFARTLPAALLALPAGVAADRWDRKRLMVAADGVRVVAVGSLATLILLQRAVFWTIPIVAFVEGAGAALSSAAQAGAVRAVVPTAQLPAAAATQTGRQAAVNLAGPPLGGALFGLARAAPFVVDAVSYLFSSLSLLAMRTPFQEERRLDLVPLRSRLAEGFRFLWGQPFLRTCALLFGLANFLGPGLLLAVVVIGRRQGLSGGEVGALVAAFGACLLLGSLLSPLVRRMLPVRAVLLLELWTWLGCALFLAWPSVYVLTAGILPTALAVPSTDSVVHGYRILIARPAARSVGVGAEHDLVADRAARAAGGWSLARGCVGARDDRRVCGGRTRGWGLGDAQSGSPSGARARRDRFDQRFAGTAPCGGSPSLNRRTLIRRSSRRPAHTDRPTRCRRGSDSRQGSGRSEVLIAPRTDDPAALVVTRVLEELPAPRRPAVAGDGEGADALEACAIGSGDHQPKWPALACG